MRTVYLIHFATAYKHAGHYIGSARDLAARMEEHRAGRGARLLQVVNEAGITWECVRTWPGSRQLERQIKNRKGARHLCPCALAQRPTNAPARRPSNEQWNQ